MTDTNRSTITLLSADGSSGGVNFCGQCKKYFASATELERHLADPSHVLEKLIRCKTCGMYFQSEVRLEAHNRTHFIDNTNNSKKYHCNYCEKSFSLPSQLKRHKRRHKSDPKCNQCDETFVTRAQLHHHEQTHSSQKESYKCRFCDKCFVTSSKFRAHEKYHTNVRAHKCAYCDKAFPSPSQLQNHERYHTGERPYKCDQCGKGFVTATVLGYHQQSHDNQAKRYKCASCKKSFVVASQLRIHERVRHTGERPFKCVHCDKAYPSHSQLQKHKQFHTGVRIGSRASDDKQFKCRRCDHDFTSAKCLERHTQSTHAKTVQEDTNRKFDCTYCNEGFGDRSSLEMHLIRHHADNKPYKCDECGLMCATISGLRSHECLHLKQTFRCLQCDKTFWTKNRFQLHEKTCSGLHKVAKQHKCSHCNKTFEYLGTLRNHQRIHSLAQVEEQFKCSHCDRVYSKAKYLKRHIQRLEQKPRECTHCHKIFKNQMCLTEHSYIHDPEKQQKCSYCDCLFTVKSLKRHLKKFNGSCKNSFTNLTRLAQQQRSHTPLTTHELSNETNCSHCGKRFGSLALLKLHERLHTGERPFKCCTCEAGFRSRLYLELHSVVHDDSKRNLNGHPFRCEQCDKSFKGHILLKFHMRRAHFAEKRFKCTHCHAAFLSAAHLGKHRRCHSEPGIKPYKLVNEPGSTYNATRPRKCPECGKIVVSHFKRHMNVHLGIKPYKCKECEECFARSDALRKHERLHKGEKQYQCTVCGKCVTLTGYLVEDKRIHTGEMKRTQCESSFNGVDELTKYVESQAAQLTEHIKKHFKCNLGENSLPLELSFEQGALQDNSVGETPYSCTDCNESFGTPSGLK